MLKDAPRWHYIGDAFSEKGFSGVGEMTNRFWTHSWKFLRASCWPRTLHVIAELGMRCAGGNASQHGALAAEPEQCRRPSTGATWCYQRMAFSQPRRRLMRIPDLILLRSDHRSPCDPRTMQASGSGIFGSHFAHALQRDVPQRKSHCRTGFVFRQSSTQPPFQ